MIVTKKHLARRTFLRGLGTTLALPEGAALLRVFCPVLTIVHHMKTSEADTRAQIEPHPSNIEKLMGSGPVSVNLCPRQIGAIIQLVPMVDFQAKCWTTVTHAKIESPEMLDVFPGDLCEVIGLAVERRLAGRGLR